MVDISASDDSLVSNVGGHKCLDSLFLEIIQSVPQGTTASKLKELDHCVSLSRFHLCGIPEKTLLLDKPRPRGIMKIQKGAVDLTVGPTWITKMLTVRVAAGRSTSF